MTEQTMKLTWLRSRQSIRDYIAARRAENEDLAETRTKNDRTRKMAPQVGRKTVTKDTTRGLRRRKVNISRMTPAPPDRSYVQEVRMPGWGSNESEADEPEVDEPPSSSKRGRDPEPVPRFIDLRTVQLHSGVRGHPHNRASPSRRQFSGRKEVPGIEELTRRAGQVPPKKRMCRRMAPNSISPQHFSGHRKGKELGQLARNRAHDFRKNLATREGSALKSISTSFQAHMAAATQMRSEELDRNTRLIQSKSRAYGIRSSARKMPVISIPDDDDDEVGSVLSFSSDTEEIYELESSSSGPEPLPPTGRARKMPSSSSPPGDAGRQEMSRYRSQTLQDSSSEGEEEGTNLGHTAALLEPSLASNLDDRIATPTVEPEPIIQLFRAFQLHTLPTDLFQEARQLPFLTRNLRQSFQSLCHNLGIPTTSLPHEQQGTVLVRYEHVANASFERSVPKWFCPLCNLLGRLATKEMLTIHLKTYHRESYIEWLQPTDNELHEGILWRLHILIPEIDENMIGHAFPSPASAETVEHEAGTADLHTSPEPDAGHAFPTTPSQTRVTTFPLTPSARGDPFMLFHPDLSPHSRQTTSVISPSRVQNGKEPATVREFRPRPSQYPRPPPSSNRLGAAARPPYLPAKSTFGGPDIYYSTRFSGPCLFDLLSLLPLEPFGIFDYQVIDREEEIYNDDELDQEEKVIVALWARWIMLNKVKFNKNRMHGVKKFIDEYWRIIHLAAGWEALVYQLLVLAAWRLLRHYEIIPLLEHYEELVGMQYWDEWDSNEE